MACTGHVSATLCSQRGLLPCSARPRVLISQPPAFCLHVSHTPSEGTLLCLMDMGSRNDAWCYSVRITSPSLGSPKVAWEPFQENRTNLEQTLQKKVISWPISLQNVRKQHSAGTSQVKGAFSKKQTELSSQLLKYATRAEAAHLHHATLQPGHAYKPPHSTKQAHILLCPHSRG